MIISHKHQFIFLKTQKTAGSSLEIGLSKYLGDDDVITPISWRWPLPSEDDKIRRELGHRKPCNFLAQIEEYRGKDIVRLLTKGRLKLRYYNHMCASALKDAVGEEMWNQYKVISCERNPFDKAISSYYWFTRKQANRVSLEEFVNEAPQEKLSNWKIYTIDDQIQTDYMIRYESLEEDLAKISNLVGLPETVKLPTKPAKGNHRKDKRRWEDVLSETSIQRIKFVCQKELAAFYPSLNQ